MEHRRDESVDYSMKFGEKHGWHVRANLPKNWVCFRKLHSWHWGCFITILELTRLPSEDVPLKRGSTGGTLFSTGGSLQVSGHTELQEDFEPSEPQDLGWASYPKPSGSLYEMCLVNKHNLVTSQLLRTKVQRWKQSSCLAWTHNHILAFLGDEKFLSNKPKGLGTSRDMNSLKASRVVTSLFCISSTRVFSVNRYLKWASRNENNHGYKVSWHQRSNLKHSTDFLNYWAVCLC